jgi:hypothetical protein
MEKQRRNTIFVRKFERNKNSVNPLVDGLVVMILLVVLISII